MKVCKFGGSSVANAEQVTKIVDVVLSDTERRIVVVSAPGKRDKADTKVTDLLIKCAEEALAGKDTEASLEAVIGRYAQIRGELNLPAGSTVADAISACDVVRECGLPLGGLDFGIWSKPTTIDSVLTDGDRVEIYRPLLVDPKVARRERFARQGARTTGLFARQRPGGKSGY